VVHTTPAREEAIRLRMEAARLTREARALSKMEGLESMAQEKIAKSKELIERSRELLAVARLEDTKVRQADYWKDTKKGRQNYPRWVVSWQEGDKIVTKYLGSVRKMSEAEALEKARKMKSEAIGIDQREGEKGK
jgi:hypothetical protein